MDKHVSNARKIAEFLCGSDAVEWVLYPELDQHPDKIIASELLPKGSGSMIAFGIKVGETLGKPLSRGSKYGHTWPMSAMQSLWLYTLLARLISKWIRIQ